MKFSKTPKKLKGLEIYVDRDLNEDKQEIKKVMLQLKKKLQPLDKKQKIVVRNDRMKINYGNKDKILMSDSKNGKEVLENIYKDKINQINFNYEELLFQKN